jgi:hypothetical protein
VDLDQAPPRKVQGLREIYPNFDIPAFNVMDMEHMDSIKTAKTWLMISKEEIPQGSIPEDEERLDYEDEKEFLNKF